MLGPGQHKFRRISTPVVNLPLSACARAYLVFPSLPANLLEMYYLYISQRFTETKALQKTTETLAFPKHVFNYAVLQLFVGQTFARGKMISRIPNRRTFTPCPWYSLPCPFPSCLQLANLLLFSRVQFHAVSLVGRNSVVLLQDQRHVRLQD